MHILYSDNTTKDNKLQSIIGTLSFDIYNGNKQPSSLS